MIRQSIKKFFEAETQQQVWNRIGAILIATVSILFVALLLVQFQTTQSNIYISDGDTVLKLSANNGVTVYRVAH